MEHVSVVIPAYDEEKGINETVKEVQKHLPESEIILVDDGSTDDTWSIMKELSEENERITCYQEENNKGKASALKLGYSKTNNDIICTIDSDYSYKPEYLPQLIRVLKEEELDLVVGSRFKQGIPNNYPRVRAVCNILGALVTSYLIREKVTDVTSGLRVMKKKITRLPTRAENLDYEAELTSRVICSGYEYGEVSVSMNPRLGMSKLSLLKHIVKFFIAMIRGAVLKDRV